MHVVSRCIVLVLISLLSAINAGVLPAGAAPIIRYDPALGTLPEAQGFTRLESLGVPSPTVAGGILHQFPISGTRNQAWQYNATPINFDVEGYVVEVILKVISSNYLPNIGTGPRFGYYVQLNDNLDRSYILGISETGVALDTDVSFSANNDFVVTPFITTDRFHTYRLVMDGAGASLFIDGSFVVSTAIGVPIPGNTTPGLIFGDASGVGISETELQWVNFESTSVPEPSSLALAIGALLVCVGSRRSAVASKICAPAHAFKQFSARLHTAVS